MMTKANRLICAIATLGVAASLSAQTTPEKPPGYFPDPADPKPEELKPNPHYNPEKRAAFYPPPATEEPIYFLRVALQKGDADAFKQALENFKGQAAAGKVLDKATLGLLVANDPQVYKDIHDLVNGSRNPTAIQRMLLVESINQMLPITPDLYESLAWFKIAKEDAAAKSTATELQTATETATKLFDDLESFLTTHLKRTAESKEAFEKKLTDVLNGLKQQGVSYVQEHPKLNEAQDRPPREE